MNEQDDIIGAFDETWTWTVEDWVRPNVRAQIFVNGEVGIMSSVQLALRAPNGVEATGGGSTALGGSGGECLVEVDGRGAIGEWVASITASNLVGAYTVMAEVSYPDQDEPASGGSAAGCGG